MNENVIKEFEGRITTVEQSAKSAHKRLDDIAKLTESVHILATETKMMREDLSEVKDRVDVIEKKPGKRWDLITTAAMSAMVSGVLGFLLSLLF